MQINSLAVYASTSGSIALVGALSGNHCRKHRSPQASVTIATKFLPFCRDECRSYDSPLTNGTQATSDNDHSIDINARRGCFP